MARKIVFLLLVVLGIMMSSCKTTSVSTDNVREVVKHDTLIINNTKTDSIYTKDSVYIKDNGDTVVVYRYKYVYRDRIVNDTLYKVKVDTIYQEKIIEKTVTKKYTFYKWIGIVGIIVLIIFIFVMLKKISY